RMLRGIFAPADHSQVPRLATSHVSLVDGELRIELPRLATLGLANEVAQALAGALPVASRLVRPWHLAPPLARNLEGDPVPAVRVANLQALLEGHRDHPVAREALQAALADPDEEVRLRAALAQGAAGQETLRAIGASPHSDDRRAARALRGLGEALS